MANYANDMTNEEFDQILQSQKKQEILKWADLEQNKVYKIVDFRNIDTKNGQSLVTILEDETEVWAPSCLSRRLQNTQKENFPVYVRPKGKTKSQQSGNMYWDFDFVFTKFISSE